MGMQEMFLLLFAWKFSQLWQNYRKHKAYWTWLTNVLRVLWLPALPQGCREGAELPQHPALGLGVGLDWALKQKERCSSCPCCHKTREDQGRQETEKDEGGVRMALWWEQWQQKCRDGGNRAGLWATARASGVCPTRTGAKPQIPLLPVLMVLREFTGIF